jgi:hypothetical protein
MVRLKSIPKTLGLCLLALGLMAIASSVAQAETGAKWSTVNGKFELKEVTEALLPSIQVKEIENATASLLFTTKGGTKVDILCTTLEMIGMKLLSKGSVSSGRLKSKGCVMKLNGTVSKACEVHTEGEPIGTILSTKGTALIVLHLETEGGSVVPLVLLKADVGEVMTHIEFGELCAIGEAIDVTGALAFRDCKNSLGTELVEHLFEEDPATSSLKVLGVPAKGDGSFLVLLSGEHKGMQWAGSSTAAKP